MGSMITDDKVLESPTVGSFKSDRRFRFLNPMHLAIKIPTPSRMKVYIVSWAFTLVGSLKDFCLIMSLWVKDTEGSVTWVRPMLGYALSCKAFWKVQNRCHLLAYIFKVWFSTRKGKYKIARFSKSREKVDKFRQGRTSIVGEALDAVFDSRSLKYIFRLEKPN